MCEFYDGTMWSIIHCYDPFTSISYQASHTVKIAFVKYL